jgi:hypothetical protein
MRSSVVRLTSSLRRHAQSAMTVLLFLPCAFAVYGADSYNGTYLTIPSVVIGSATYSDVVVTPGRVLNVGGGAPNGSVDTYNPANSQLTIPSVVYGANTYHNVLITVGGLISIGSASWVDTYDSSSRQLRISSVQVGSTVYNNAVITPATIINVGGGMPAEVQDEYNSANRQLTIAAVQDGTQIFTNVTITVGEVISLGAASRFDDAPVEGLCYSTSPSATASASPTNVNGQFLYDSGDIVSFWIDGTGGGCTGTAASSSGSVSLGQLAPTGSQSFVLAIPAGFEAGATLTALNIGNANLMDVGGLRLLSTDAASLDQFISSQGATLPAGTSGSVDTFFRGVQADTVLASDSAAPPFVSPVAANASTEVSNLENKVMSDLLATAGNLPGQPTSISVPPSGELKLTMAGSEYTCPICAAPATTYSSGSASFVYLDGHGGLVQFVSPGDAAITASNLADLTTTGTYSIDANVLSKSGTGTDVTNAYTYSFSQDVTENYLDALTLIATASFSKTFTSGPYQGGEFARGSLAFNSYLLGSLTLPVLAGHTITLPGCGPTTPNVLTFVGVGAGPASVTETQSQTCGSVLPLTYTSTEIPGVLKATDTSGFIGYFGLYGAGLVPGANFVIIQEAPGVGSSKNGSVQQWAVVGPILSVD